MIQKHKKVDCVMWSSGSAVRRMRSQLDLTLAKQSLTKHGAAHSWQYSTGGMTAHSLLVAAIVAVVTKGLPKTSITLLSAFRCFAKNFVVNHLGALNMDMHSFDNTLLMCFQRRGRLGGGHN